MTGTTADLEFSNIKPGAKIAADHLEDVVRGAKFRARGLLESWAFISAHTDGLPSEFLEMAETIAVIVDQTQRLQSQLERMTKEKRAGKLNS